MFYQRVPRLFAALALARGDGRYARRLKQLARVDLLILTIVGDRYNAGPLIITSQVPVDRWHDIVGDDCRAVRPSVPNAVR